VAFPAHALLVVKERIREAEEEGIGLPEGGGSHPARPPYPDLRGDHAMRSLIVTIAVVAGRVRRATLDYD
jgi:hypothetical protein